VTTAEVQLRHAFEVTDITREQDGAVLDADPAIE
jgi:hypothetical protein